MIRVEFTLEISFLQDRYHSLQQHRNIWLKQLCYHHTHYELIAFVRYVLDMCILYMHEK